MQEEALVKSPEKYSWRSYTGAKPRILRHRNGSTKFTLKKGVKFGHRISRSGKLTRIIVPEFGPTIVFTLTHRQLENLMNKSKTHKGRKPSMKQDRRKVIATDTFKVKQKKDRRGHPTTKQAYLNGSIIHLTGKETEMLEALLDKEQTLGSLLTALYGTADRPELKIIKVFALKLQLKLENKGGKSGIFISSDRIALSKDGKPPSGFVESDRVVKVDSNTPRGAPHARNLTSNKKHIKVYDYFQKLGKPVLLTTAEETLKIKAKDIVNICKKLNRLLDQNGAGYVRIGYSDMKRNKIVFLIEQRKKATAKLEPKYEGKTLKRPPRGVQLFKCYPVAGEPVKAEVATEDGAVESNWGAKQYYRKGKDFVVAHGPGDTEVVRSDIFKKTYRPVMGKEGTYEQRTNVKLRFWKVQFDCTIKTLNGPVKAKKGQICMVGTVGEMWPMATQKFIKKYEHDGKAFAG